MNLNDFSMIYSIEREIYL